MLRIVLGIISLLFCCCQQPKILNRKEVINKEFEKIFNHYSKTGERDKLKAAKFIIENISTQYHYTGKGIVAYRKIFSKMDSSMRADNKNDYWKKWDSIQLNSHIPNFSTVKKTMDEDSISAAFLIRNIDQAFVAWRRPWAKALDFDEFCNYILPYKANNEAPENWRNLMLSEYKWLPDSMGTSTDLQVACRLVNSDLMKKFYINARFTCDWDVNLADFLTLKTGTCEDATQYTLYAMRAMGIPVVMDFTPLWGNKNGGHGWNSLLKNKKTLHFVGTETHPGMDKVQFTRTYWMKRKLAKVFRRTYKIQPNYIANIADDQTIPGHLDNANVLDVTDQYVPVSEIHITDDGKSQFDGKKIAYLCVFNNLKWQAVHWAKTEGNTADFSMMGRDVVYLPATYDESGYQAISNPFYITMAGKKQVITPILKNRSTVKILSKYPEGKSNNIIVGRHYELFYWDRRWISLGKKIAISSFIEFQNVPQGALLWIRDLNKGFQERIFTIENGEQKWW